MAKRKMEESNVDDNEDLMSIVEFSEDISEAEEPAPLPEREYPAEIIAATVETSATKGTKYAKVSFRVQEEDYPADYDAQNAPGGTTLFNMVGLEDNAAARHRLRRFSEAVGAPMGKRIDVTKWIGLSALVTVKHEEYEGVTRAKISRVNEA